MFVSFWLAIVNELAVMLASIILVVRVAHPTP